MFTGVDPGEHGIFQFWQTKSVAYRPRTVAARDACREALWDILARAGMRVGVVNVPMTHPPKSLPGGYMISWPLAPTIHYSEPPDLIRELASRGMHFHSDIVTMYRGQDNYLDLTKEYIDKRTETLIELQRIHPVDAMIVVYTELDRVSHHYWGRDEAPDAAVKHTYELMDRALGRVMETLAGPDTLLVVASDHGFGRCTANLNIHRLLEEAGLLAARWIPDGATASQAVDDLADGDAASWFTSSHRYRRTIDWSRTKVYMPTPGCFGLNLNLCGREAEGIVDPGEVDAVADAVRMALATLRRPGADTGESPFTLVPANGIYRGNQIDAAPDFILQARGWDIMPHPSLDQELWAPPSQQGVHQPDGILALAGPGVTHGGLLDARIVDVMPTILALLDLPVPEEIDGRWLVEPGRPVRRVPATRPTTEAAALSRTEEFELERRLAQLGYL